MLSYKMLTRTLYHCLVNNTTLCHVENTVIITCSEVVCLSLCGAHISCECHKSTTGYRHVWQEWLFNSSSLW